MPTFFNDDGDEPGIGPPGRGFSSEAHPPEPAATEKQVKFAKWIADTLNIRLPEKKTKKAYSEFIGKNRPAFEEELARRRDLECEWPDNPEWGPEPEY